MEAAKPPSEEKTHHPAAGEILKYQRWVLRVFIHCDGCKKKVKKVLQGIDGVYTTEVDSREHKVIVTGNVEADTLIKRLLKTGKYAELLPEKQPPPAEKNHNKKKSGKTKGGGGGGEGDDVNNDEKKNNEPAGGDVGSKEGSADGDEGSDKDDECDEEEGATATAGGEGGNKKKKKKKKKKSNTNNGDGSAAPPGGEANSKVDDGGDAKSPAAAEVVSAKSVASSLPHQQPVIQNAYPYPYPPPPQMYYSPPSLPPTPAYGLSYNTAYPLSSASYYVGSPIMPMHHAYATTYPHLPPPPPSHPISHYVDDDHQDQYQGGCSIM
ncbi:hypothetical protein HN51_039232 [Arachis hypogaea]|uniref:HMA domain-containing protein n=1 Tax=Arachis hypogaea TaxID=3818 RepID=A0A444YIE9_ARAHY|nr:heavy metal-associated isoprenylated plant protein 36 [Arachis ipaensis]XP_025660748.1 heavy metal-associated isoprenylated plant protein 36 [Arachis hypogaea]QHN84711.1 uncharacterized protein DS421_16g531020 [Arachis hypogaea]RYR01649.1 hypothetical protein Ahy_B06g080529 [Arachis hypogaea]